VRRLRWWRWLPIALWLAGNGLLATVLPPHPRAKLPIFPRGRDVRVFTPDGRRLMTGTVDGLQLWDVDSGREAYSLAWEGGAKSFPKDLVASPDGRHALGCSGPFTEVVLFDLVAGRRTVLAPLAGLYPGGACGQFAPDGRSVAVATAWPANPKQPFLLGPSQDGMKVVVWDVNAQTQRFRLSGAMGPVAFSPDGRTLAAVAIKADETRELRLWDAATGESRGTVPGSERVPPIGSGRSMTRLAFSPDGGSLLTGVAGWPHVRPVPLIFNLAEGSQYELTESLHAEWLADGGLMTVSDLRDGRFEVREGDRRTGVPRTRWSLTDPSWPSTGGGWATLSADGRLLASQWTAPLPAWRQWLLKRLGRQRLPFIESRAVIELWDAPSGRNLGRLDAEGRRLWQAPDRRTLVTIERDGSLSVWDVPPVRPWPLFLALLTAQAALAAAFVAWRRRRAARRKLAAGLGSG
jgi:WD40 repeat protein